MPARLCVIVHVSLKGLHFVTTYLLQAEKGKEGPGGTINKQNGDCDFAMIWPIASSPIKGKYSIILKVDSQHLQTFAIGHIPPIPHCFLCIWL